MSSSTQSCTLQCSDLAVPYNQHTNNHLPFYATFFNAVSQELCLLQSIPELDPICGKAHTGNLLLSSSKVLKPDVENEIFVGRLVAPINVAENLTLSNLSIGLKYLSRQMESNNVVIIPVYDTESSWEMARLASIYLLEELKLIALAWKLQKLRYTNAATKYANSSKAEIESLFVTIGQNLQATKYLAHKCQQRRVQTDLVIAQMLELCK